MHWLQKILGGKKMAALAPGKKAPEFSLPEMNGQTISLSDTLARGPVVAVFFKVSCPVCQYALPFLERIYKAHGNKNVTFLGVSENEKKDTVAFLKEYGVTFPVLLEDTRQFPVSNAYGLTNVPTIFWIGQDGEIEISSVGWVRKDLEELSRKAAEVTGSAANPLFQPGEQVPDYRPG